MTTKEPLDNWDAFTGSFLKADMVKDESIGFVVNDVELFEGDDDQKARPRLTLDVNGTELLFDLNKTNAEKCKELKIDSPRTLLGKRIFFRRVLATNPQTKKEVESLRIIKIE